MTKEEIQKYTEEINALSHEEMASLFRYAPVGHHYFNVEFLLHEVFSKRFEELGGITPTMSRAIER